MNRGTSVVAALLLLLGAGNALMAWNVETCTGNAPDSLFGGVLTMPLTLLGFALLAWRPNLCGALLGGALPAIVALTYTVDTARLLGGTPACELVTGNGPWEPSGDENFLGKLWLTCTLTFWLGLALAVHRGYRAQFDDRHEESNE